MVKRKDLGRVLHSGTIFVLCASMAATAQTPQSAPAPPQTAPTLTLPPDMNLPTLSPAVIQQSVPPGPDAQQAPGARPKKIPRAKVPGIEIHQVGWRRQLDARKRGAKISAEGRCAQ